MPLGLASGAPIGHAAPPLAWWRWEDMLQWLACPEDRDHVRPSTLGLPPMNVAESGPMRWLPTPEDWRPTTGPVPVIPPPADGPRLDPRREATLRLSLGFAVDAQLDGTWLRLGADRQPFALDEDEGASTGPSAALTPPDVRPAGGRVRVILLTPGAFAPVSVPCASRLEALGVRLVAAAVGQPLRATGWAEDDGPAQPCRRMAPAGSVYWLDVLDGDAEAWARRHHFDSLCELPQDRLDGLGQFVVGVA
jgi:CRISPR-associated protein Cmr3